MSNKIREAAVAGGFYPKEKNELKKIIHELLDEAEQSLSHENKIPKAIIAPHAGYIYSGIVAAKAFAILHKAKDKIKNIVLIGVTHRLPVIGLAITNTNEFRTPLGLVDINKDIMQNLQTLSQIVVSDKAHEFEHSIEVMLPILQTLLTDFKIIPILTSNTDTKSTVEVLEKIWGDDETLIVISSDLSHYHEYTDAIKIDNTTVKNILALDPCISHEEACGATGINAIITLAKEKKLNPKLITLQNSGDTAGSKDQVVGYTAIHFY